MKKTLKEGFNFLKEAMTEVKKVDPTLIRDVALESIPAALVPGAGSVVSGILLNGRIKKFENNAEKYVNPDYDLHLN